jgi:hypothetical protein
LRLTDWDLGAAAGSYRPDGTLLAFNSYSEQPGYSGNIHGAHRRHRADAAHAQPRRRHDQMSVPRGPPTAPRSGSHRRATSS